MTATDHAPDTGHDSHDAHVSDWVYIKIAIVLAILTAIEVFTYFESVHQMSDTLLVLTLTVLMVAKFILVAAYFMHLKYDNAIFTKFIAAGLILAWPVYGVFAFAKASDVKKLGKNVGKPGKVEPAYIVSPPRVTLMGTVSQTEEESVHFSGVANDEDAVRERLHHD